MALGRGGEALVVAEGSAGGRAGFPPSPASATRVTARPPTIRKRAALGMHRAYVLDGTVSRFPAAASSDSRDAPVAAAVA
jgi:hypothetical protein